MLLQNQSQLHTWLQSHAGAMIYFSARQCSVCHALKPKISALLQQQLPAISMAEVACHQRSELAAQFGIFSVPALVVFFDQQEVYRKAGVFSPSEVARDLQRSYRLFFAPDRCAGR